MAFGRTKSKRTKDFRILEACLSLAEVQGWANVRLIQVADKLDISLAEIHHQYRDLDAIADVWFERALVTMLSKKGAGFNELHPRERLQVSLLLWLDALSEYRRVTIQMIGLKMHPPHVHHWVPLIFSLSRLIHWWLDAAAISSRGRQRQIEEIGLTAIFLATLVFWANDDSEGQEKTRRFLAKRLKHADCLMTKAALRNKNAQ